MLYEYESFLRKEQGEPLEFALNEILSRDEWRRPNYEIEHIWPQNPSRLGLSSDELTKHEQNVHKLGNLTLVAKGWNRRMGNAPFKRKCKEYKKSSFKIQRILQLNREWGKKQIEERENKLVTFVLMRWKI